MGAALDMDGVFQYFGVCCYAGIRAFRDEISLELRQSGEDMKHRPAARRRRINLLGQRTELDTLLHVHVHVHVVDEMTQRPPKTIELPHHHRVTRPWLIKHARELRTIRTRTTTNIDEGRKAGWGADEHAPTRLVMRRFRR